MGPKKSPMGNEKSKSPQKEDNASTSASSAAPYGTRRSTQRAPSAPLEFYVATDEDNNVFPVASSQFLSPGRSTALYPPEGVLIPRAFREDAQTFIQTMPGHQRLSGLRILEGPFADLQTSNNRAKVLTEDHNRKVQMDSFDNYHSSTKSSQPPKKPPKKLPQKLQKPARSAMNHKSGQNSSSQESDENTVIPVKILKPHEIKREIVSRRVLQGMTSQAAQQIRPHHVTRALDSTRSSNQGTSAAMFRQEELRNALSEQMGSAIISLEMPAPPMRTGGPVQSKLSKPWGNTANNTRSNDSPKFSSDNDSQKRIARKAPVMPKFKDDDYGRHEYFKDIARPKLSPQDGLKGSRKFGQSDTIIKQDDHEQKVKQKKPTFVIKQYKKDAEDSVKAQEKKDVVTFMRILQDNQWSNQRLLSSPDSSEDEERGVTDQLRRFDGTRSMVAPISLAAVARINREPQTMREVRENIILLSNQLRDLGRQLSRYENLSQESRQDAMNFSLEQQLPIESLEVFENFIERLRSNRAFYNRFVNFLVFMISQDTASPTETLMVGGSFVIARMLRAVVSHRVRRFYSRTGRIRERELLAQLKNLNVRRPQKLPIPRVLVRAIRIALRSISRTQIYATSDLAEAIGSWWANTQETATTRFQYPTIFNQVTVSASESDESHRGRDGYSSVPEIDLTRQGLEHSHNTSTLAVDPLGSQQVGSSGNDNGANIISMVTIQGATCDDSEPAPKRQRVEEQKEEEEKEDDESWYQEDFLEDVEEQGDRILYEEDD